MIQPLTDNIRYESKVRNSEVDSQGIVHHARYLDFMECARIKHFNDIGANLYVLGKQNIDLVVTNINVDYMYPLHVDDLYQVESILDFEPPLKYRFINNIYSNNKLCVKAYVEGCAINRLTKKIDRKIIHMIMNKYVKSLEHHKI